MKNPPIHSGFNVRRFPLAGIETPNTDKHHGGKTQKHQGTVFYNYSTAFTATAWSCWTIKTNCNKFQPECQTDQNKGH